MGKWKKSSDMAGRKDMSKEEKNRGPKMTMCKREK